MKLLLGGSLLAFGLLLLGALLYDAGEVTDLLRLDRGGNEGLVAAIGLSLAAGASAAGGRILRRSRPATSATDGH